MSTDKHLINIVKKIEHTIKDIDPGLKNMIEYQIYDSGQTKINKINLELNHHEISSSLILISDDINDNNYSKIITGLSALFLFKSGIIVHDEIGSGTPNSNGRDTLWWKWGPAQAINAGDCLYSLSRLLIINDDNLGFSKSVNIGIEQSRGNYTCILNPDTNIMSNCLSGLIDYMNLNPDIDAITPKILNSDGSFQNSCKRSEPGILNSIYRILGFDKIFPNPKKQIEFVMKQKYKDIEEALGNLWKDKDKVKVKGKEYDALIFFGSILDDILLKIETPYKIFQNKRLYSVSDNIGCFNLQRDKYDLNDIFWNHWEYFAYKSPIWKERFDKYNINVNHKKQIIEFKKEDELEEFYKNYGFDPDEQKINIQERSTKKIKKIKISDWLNNIFKKKEKTIRMKLNYE